MVRQFDTFASETLSACQDAIASASRIDDVINLDRSAFARAIKGPIDRVIMRKTQHAAVVAPVLAACSDIGSWTALADLINGPKEGKNSVTSGNALQINCSGGMIRSDGPFVATIRPKDIIIVEGKNGILILHKDDSQDVKKVVEHLKVEGRTDLL